MNYSDSEEPQPPEHPVNANELSSQDQEILLNFNIDQIALE